MAFWTYAIRSVSTGRLYTGHTMDLSRRLKEHNDPESFSSCFTKRIPGPWIFVHSESFHTRREAFGRERWRKTGKGREYLSEILKLGC